MNDPVRAMQRCGLVLVIAACTGDPTLDVAVHHPAGYAVTQTRVTVYFGDDVRCNEIEFGDRTDAELAAIAVSEATSGGRVEVSRLGGKSIVARGFDAQDRFVTAGCKDLGELAGTTAIQIDTQPTAVVAIDPAQPDRPFSERTILVNMTDTSGMPLDGTVSWQLTGPAGAPVQQPSAGIATRGGDVKIHVDDLGTPGPEGLRIRVPWATAPLPLVTGFDLSHATVIPLDGGPLTGNLHPSCDLRGHAGKLPTLVCLTPATVQGHRDVVEIAWQTDHYASTPRPLPAAIDNQFALFVDHDGSADEPVYVISGNGTGAGNWYKLDAPGTGTVMAFGDALQNVVYVPACHDNSAMPLVGIETGGATAVDNEAFFTVTGGGPVSTPAPGSVFSAGCVCDVDRKEHQAVVVTGMGGDATLVLVSAAGQMQMIPGTRLTGSGFVAVETQGMIEKRFAGTRLQASGTVVYEAVLAPEGSSFKLVERTEIDAAAPPTKIVGGKLDQDGDTDLVWDMAAGVRRRLFQVSLAEQVGGAPLTAITSGPTPPIGTNTVAAVDFLTGNLVGHRTDQLVLFTPTTVTIYAAD
jgi:hypothetical protein